VGNHGFFNRAKSDRLEGAPESGAREQGTWAPGRLAVPRQSRPRGCAHHNPVKSWPAKEGQQRKDEMLSPHRSLEPRVKDAAQEQGGGAEARRKTGASLAVVAQPSHGTWARWPASPRGSGKAKRPWPNTSIRPTQLSHPQRPCGEVPHGVEVGECARHLTALPFLPRASWPWPPEVLALVNGGPCPQR